MEPSDYLGYIGRNPGNTHVYIATGDSGQGMTHCTIAGMLIRDLVLERRNAWAEIYSPSRLPLENLTIVAEYAKENLNVAAQYRDYLTPGDVENVARIAPGSGAVLRDGAHKIAAYRADDGQLHVRSAVCPHLQCIVDWNTTEKTWDCPCHGSRFTATGRVINGPANTDLAMIDPTPDERQRAQQQNDGENAAGRETERPLKQAGRADATDGSNGDETFPESEPPSTKIQGDKYGLAKPDVRGNQEG
jgi:Rieske Fe-S protein